MKKCTQLAFLLLLSIGLITTSCSSTKLAAKTAKKYVGNWDYKVAEIPVDLDGTLVISFEEGTYSADMITPMGTAEISDITIVDNKLKASFDADGNYIDLEGTFGGNSYKGLFMVSGSEFDMTMEKK
jgi:hypothetical protein